MQRFTDERTAATPDEIWFLEHPPVFTLGMNAKREHVLAPGDIPVVQIDRGGQVTYHGPGQLVVYPLIDLRRAKLGIRDLVTALERAVIDYAGDVRRRRPSAAAMRPACTWTAASSRASASACAGARAITASRSTCATISSLSRRINPCGYAGLEMTRACDLGGPASVANGISRFQPFLLQSLGYARTAPPRNRPVTDPRLTS